MGWGEGRETQETGEIYVYVYVYVYNCGWFEWLYDSNQYNIYSVVAIFLHLKEEESRLVVARDGEKGRNGCDHLMGMGFLLEAMQMPWN